MKLLASLTASVAVTIALTSGAGAAILTDTLPEFNYDGPDFEVSPEQVVGTFTFGILPEEEAISATLTGTFGNSVATSSATADLFGDGVFLGSCLFLTECNFMTTPFSFPVTDLTTLQDGSLTLSLIQTDLFAVRLGPTTLTVETAGAETPIIPLPAGLPLLLAGIAGFAALRRTRP